MRSVLSYDMGGLSQMQPRTRRRLLPGHAAGATRRVKATTHRPAEWPGHRAMNDNQSASCPRPTGRPPRLGSTLALRAISSCFLALMVFGAAACGSGASASGSHGASAALSTVSPSARATIDPESAAPTATATAATAEPAWTTKAVAVVSEARADASVQVHLGVDFPLTLTSRNAVVDGAVWDEAAWQTPGRGGTGWLPEADLTGTKPSAVAEADFDAMDQDLADYLGDLGSKVGVSVLDITRGTSYGYNSGTHFIVASSMKVPIMLTLYSQLEAKKKKPTAAQVQLLTTMIENSSNDSATNLYKQIGWQRGINNFMKSVGISGLSPAPTTIGWGYSTITPAAMVALLAKLNNGSILNATDRNQALYWMRHIESDQRVGVGDSSPEGAIVEMKDGYVAIDDESGPYVMNSSGIVIGKSEVYIIAVYTIRDRNTSAGFDIARHVCKVVGQKLMGES